MRYGDETGQALAAVESLLSAKARELIRSADLGSVREFVRALDGCFQELGRVAGLDEDWGRLVRQSAIQASFPVLLSLRAGELNSATGLVFEIWARTAESLGVEVRMGRWGDVREVAVPYLSTGPEEAHELLTTFQAAVFELFRSSASQANGREILRRLMTLLGLSYDQLGRLFGVAGETVRRWERGSHAIPDERLPDLAQADSALSRLLAVFRPDRLLQVVRRKAELFDKETALAWILRGRIADVAGRYETALAYQG